MKSFTAIAQDVAGAIVILSLLAAATYLADVATVASPV